MQRAEKEYTVQRKGRLRGTFPRQGCIAVHAFDDGTPSGAILMKCPVCSGLQHNQATLEGPDDAPTIVGPIKCGCVRCGVTFHVRAGKAFIVEPVEKGKSPPLDESLIDAGVFYQSTGAASKDQLPITLATVE